MINNPIYNNWIQLNTQTQNTILQQVTICTEEKSNFYYSIVISMYAKPNLTWSISNIGLFVNTIYNCMQHFKNKTKMQHMLD